MDLVDRVLGRLARPAARRAIERCYQIPYEDELTRWELRGMEDLERLGEVSCDRGQYPDAPYHVRRHWHVRR